MNHPSPFANNTHTHTHGRTRRRRAFALDLWSIYFYVGTLLINVSMYAKLETSLPLLMGLLVAKVAVLDWSAASSSR